MKKLIVLLLALSLFACEKQAFTDNETDKATVEQVGNDKVNVFFTDENEIISFEMVIIVEQLNDFEVWGYYFCGEKMKKIENFRTIAECQAFMTDLTINGYYILP